ncbi:hypothetical protein OF001_U110072 [Pseudomonas sp. OF001]|nr:hypothetical protein OF001_U110072 [Pseudomonas sp. OF001]
MGNRSRKLSVADRKAAVRTCSGCPQLPWGLCCRGEYRNGRKTPTMKNRPNVHYVHIVVFKGFFQIKSLYRPALRCAGGRVVQAGNPASARGRVDR